MRRFLLERLIDETGASGTGIVAEGVVWSDGTATLKWRGDYGTEVSHRMGLASVIRLHVDAHGPGANQIIWLDD